MSVTHTHIYFLVGGQLTGTEIERVHDRAQRLGIAGAGSDADGDGDVVDGLDVVFGLDVEVEAVAGLDGFGDGDADDSGAGEGDEGN